jgi:hypothetical protein
MEAKTAGPVIWVDLEPTKNGNLLNFSDSRSTALIRLQKWRKPIKLLRCRHKDGNHPEFNSGIRYLHRLW